MQAEIKNIKLNQKIQDMAGLKQDVFYSISRIFMEVSEAIFLVFGLLINIFWILLKKCRTINIVLTKCGVIILKYKKIILLTNNIGSLR
jgi:hypothetical protein